MIGRPHPELDEVHPHWWVEHLEYLEAIDEPGGVAYGRRTELKPMIVSSLERRGLVTTRVQPVDVQAGPSVERLTFPWVELTERGRDVFERDLGPPPPLPRTRAVQ